MNSKIPPWQQIYKHTLLEPIPKTRFAFFLINDFMLTFQFFKIEVLSHIFIDALGDFFGAVMKSVISLVFTSLVLTVFVIATHIIENVDKFCFCLLSYLVKFAWKDLVYNFTMDLPVVSWPFYAWQYWGRRYNIHSWWFIHSSK